MLSAYECESDRNVCPSVVSSDADLVVLRRIRTLLHEQGMTIEGARRVLERECAESGDGKARTSAEDMLRHVESELMALQALLGRQRLKPTR